MFSTCINEYSELLTRIRYFSQTTCPRPQQARFRGRTLPKQCWRKRSQRLSCSRLIVHEFCLRIIYPILVYSCAFHLGQVASRILSQIRSQTASLVTYVQSSNVCHLYFPATHPWFVQDVFLLDSEAGLAIQVRPRLDTPACSIPLTKLLASAKTTLA